MDPNNLFYEINGLRTFSKNEALILAAGDTGKISFFQQDDFWSLQNWQIEPQQSFAELCKIRCQQIKDNFDWLCLWLSAGYDSMTILQSFIDADIKLDEIAYIHRLDYYADPEVPFIQQTIKDYQKNHNSKVKINPMIVDANYTLNIYREQKQILLFHKGQNQKLSKSTATFTHQYHSDLLRSKDETPRARADIYGKEKPRLDIKDGWWWVQTQDKMWQEELNSQLEFFYISDQLPELHIKQCYMVSSWFESLPGLSHDLVHKIQSHHIDYYRDWNRACGRIEVLCPDSRSGMIKNHYRSDLTSPDGLKLYEYIKKNDSAIYNSLLEQEQYLRKIIGHNLNPVILGKSWPLRPVKNQS